MRTHFLIPMVLLTCASLFSCIEDSGNSAGSLPSAQGAPGEVILVIDSNTFNGIVGDQIKEIFFNKVEFLPRSERVFDLRRVNPGKMNAVLKQAKNIIYVTVLNDKSKGNRILKTNFTKESIKQINEKPDLFKFSKQNEFARGQEILHLFGLTEEDLARNLAENQESLRSHFNKIEEKRKYKKVYGAKEVKGIEAVIQKKFEAKLKVPHGYELVIEDENFAWIRLLHNDADRSIFITYKEYTSEEQFHKDSIISFRNEMAKKHIFGNPEKPMSFVVIENKYFPVFTNEVNFNGKYAVEMRGLWKTNTDGSTGPFLGGPFVSYTFVDERLKRLYYIEGFLYCPDRKQREFVRELEVILKTFQDSSELQSSK